MRTGDLDTSGVVWESVPGRHKGEHLGKERLIDLGPLRPGGRPALAEAVRTSTCSSQSRLREWDAGRKHGRRSPMIPSQRAQV